MHLQLHPPRVDPNFLSFDPLEIGHRCVRLADGGKGGGSFRPLVGLLSFRITLLASRLPTQLQLLISVHVWFLISSFRYSLVFFFLILVSLRYGITIMELTFEKSKIYRGFRAISTWWKNHLINNKNGRMLGKRIGK